ILGNQGPHPIIVAWTVSDSGEDLIRMIRAGCAGYALKDSGPKELDRALMTAFHGEMPVPRKMIPEVITRAVARQERPAGAPPALSPREREVLRLGAHAPAEPERAVDAPAAPAAAPTAAAAPAAPAAPAAATPLPTPHRPVRSRTSASRRSLQIGFSLAAFLLGLLVLYLIRDVLGA